MPTMADITVKKADGTTNVTYSAINPAAGDKAPALWINGTVGTVLAARPRFTVSSASNGTRKARRIRTTFVWPKSWLDAAGNPVVAGGASSESSHLVPQDMQLTDIEEYVAQYAGLLYSALVRNCIVSGYAPGG